tara:strand:+ start:537 stop:872 length:336 start_codon:yes stop_codon:yes gene_type:complete
MKIENRLFMFIAISVITINGYQCYFNYQVDKSINEALEASNKSVVRYVEINNETREKMEQWRSAAEHWKAMYHGSKTANYQLEQQIEVVSLYWKEQYLKVADELFDIKNTK